MTPEQYIKIHLPGALRVSSLEKFSAWVAGRSVALIVGGTVGAVLTASLGVSAHTGSLPVFQSADRETASEHESQSLDDGSAVGLEVQQALRPIEKPDISTEPKAAATEPTPAPTQPTVASVAPTHPAATSTARPAETPETSTQKDE
jgi:hypothetical protein